MLHAPLWSWQGWPVQCRSQQVDVNIFVAGLASSLPYIHCQAILIGWPDRNCLASFLTWIRMVGLNTAWSDESVPGPNTQYQPINVSIKASIYQSNAI